jgi:hypothetical protein
MMDFNSVNVVPDNDPDIDVPLGDWSGSEDYPHEADRLTLGDFADAVGMTSEDIDALMIELG